EPAPYGDDARRSRGVCGVAEEVISQSSIGCAHTTRSFPSTLTNSKSNIAKLETQIIRVPLGNPKCSESEVCKCGFINLARPARSSPGVNRRPPAKLRSTICIVDCSKSIGGRKSF